MYKPEAWRYDDSVDDILPSSPSASNPSVFDQCRLLDLLGRINYRIISGKRVYVEVDGVVYKTLYGGAYSQASSTTCSDVNKSLAARGPTTPGMKTTTRSISPLLIPKKDGRRVVTLCRSSSIVILLK
jgi:hypothetical protein